MAPFFIDNMSDSASTRPSCRPVPSTGLGCNSISSCIGTPNAKHARAHAHDVPIPITARRACNRNELLPPAVRDIRGGGGGADAGNGESDQFHGDSPPTSPTSDEANSIIQSFEEELVRIRLQIEAEAEQQWEEWRRELVERRRMRKRLQNEEQEKRKKEQQEEMEASKEEDAVRTEPDVSTDTDEYKDGNISSDKSEEIVSESELILLDDDEEEELENADFEEGIDNGMQSVEVVDDIVDGVEEECDDLLINTQEDIGFIGDYDAPTDSDDELSGHEEDEAFQDEFEQKDLADDSEGSDAATSNMKVESDDVDDLNVPVERQVNESDDLACNIPKKRRKQKKKKKKKRKKSQRETAQAEERSDDPGRTSLIQTDVALAPTKENSSALRPPSFTRKVVFYVGFAAFLSLFKMILDALVRKGLQ